MMEDIKRICEDPKAEDREWFPELAGCDDWRGAMKEAWKHYRDESFILQYLSPTVMRHFHMFAIADDAKKNHMDVAAIHNERGFRRVREILASMYDLGMHEPNIQVTGADLAGDRTLHLQHVVYRDRKLDTKTKSSVMGHIERLWGHRVRLEEKAAGE